MKHKSLFLVCALQVVVVIFVSKVDRIDSLSREFQYLAIDYAQLSSSLVEDLSKSVVYSHQLLDQYEQVDLENRYYQQQVSFLTDPDSYVEELLDLIADESFMWHVDGWGYTHCLYPLKIYFTHNELLEQFEDVAFIAWDKSVLIDGYELTYQQRQKICATMRQRFGFQNREPLRVNTTVL